MVSIISSWSCWTHVGARHHLPVLLNSSWHMSCPPAPAGPSWHSLSPPASPGPVLVPIITSWSCPTYLGAHHLCVALLDLSWCPSSPPGPAQHILASCHLCLALLDTSWHLSCLFGLAGTILTLIMSSSNHLDCPSSLLGPAQNILVPIVSSCSCWTHLGACHLLLVLLDPSWHPSSPPAPARPISVAIISALPCWIHLGICHVLLVLLGPPWSPLAPPHPAQTILAPIISA